REERCNNKDDNCNGRIDEPFARKRQACTVRQGECTFQGKLKCSAGKLSCFKGAPVVRSGYRQLNIRISPKNKTFKIRYRGKRRSIRNSYCIQVRGRFKISISARRYQLCVFYVSSRKRRLKLNMKRSSDLEEETNYCSK
ncbi:MAG: hypothetical protein AAGJ35_06900, partial [Myxococcota bacterium]